VITRAATFFPAKLSGPAPGAFQVDLNLYEAPDRTDGAMPHRSAIANAGTAHFFIDPPESELDVSRRHVAWPTTNALLQQGTTV
jgi:hypothetical protein